MKIKKRRTNVMPLVISIASRDLDIELYNLYEELRKGNITNERYMKESIKIRNEYSGMKIIV